MTSAEAIIVPADTFSATDFASNSFLNQPRDDRYVNYEFRKFGPTTSLVNATTVDFLCPPLYGASNMYAIRYIILLLHTPKGQFKISYYHIFRDAQLLVKLKLTKADGTSAPKQNAKVSVQNNVLHSLFESIGHIFHISTLCFVH